MSGAVAVHLWQSTLFGLAAWLLTFAFKRNAARVRYGIWFAASLKFLVPFAWLGLLGRQLSWHLPAIHLQALSTACDLLAAPAMISRPQVAAASLQWILVALWVSGVLALLIRWRRRWMKVEAMLLTATPLDIGAPLPTVMSASMIEPGIVGIFRPVLVLPHGIAQELDAEQLQAIVAHELCHVRRHDNLTASIHMLVEALFWFHPLVWWMGSRLLDEREAACDEDVITTGHSRATYAESILKICRLCVESQLACVSGATGADLQRRVRTIMNAGEISPLGIAGKVLLATLAAATFAVPVASGITIDPADIAHSTFAQKAIRFDAVSMTPTGKGFLQHRHFDARSGRVTMKNISLRQLIASAYDVNQVSGRIPALDQPRYDIEAQWSNLTHASDIDEQSVYRALVRKLVEERFNFMVYVNSQCDARC